MRLIPTWFPKRVEVALSQISAKTIRMAIPHQVPGRAPKANAGTPVSRVAMVKPVFLAELDAGLMTVPMSSLSM